MRAVRSLTCGHLRNEDRYRKDPGEEWTEREIRLVNSAEELLTAMLELRELLVYSHNDESRERRLARAETLARSIG